MVATTALADLEPFFERGTTLLNQIAAIWSYQLTSVDGRSLTVGKVVIALLVLAVGVPIARMATRRFARRALGRVGLEVGAAEAMATLGFYVVLAGLVIFAL